MTRYPGLALPTAALLAVLACGDDDDGSNDGATQGTSDGTDTADGGDAGGTGTDDGAGSGGGSTGGTDATTGSGDGGTDSTGGTTGDGSTDDGGSGSTGGTTDDGATSSGGGTSSGGTSSGGSTGDSTGGTTSGATLDCTLVWSSGFENGFPGEWDSYDNGSWSPDGTMPPGRVSAWTIVDQSSGEPIHSGDHAYKAWIVGAANESHRPYPNTSAEVPTPFVNTFWVYMDLDYGILGNEWVHFGTWGNYKDGNGLYALHTMSVRHRLLEFAHTDPFSGEYIGPDPQPEYPLRQWVRFTVYGHYEGATGFVQVWQDGVPMLRADVAQLASYPGTEMSYAHWGMYAGSTASQGTQYNDDISLWSLDVPLTDLQTEPDCWRGP